MKNKQQVQLHHAENTAAQQPWGGRNGKRYAHRRWIPLSIMACMLPAAYGLYSYAESAQGDKRSADYAESMLLAHADSMLSADKKLPPAPDAEQVRALRAQAEQGDATAQYNLGVCYANGKGVEKDAEEAVKWYHKAAEQGNARAQYNLGVC